VSTPMRTVRAAVPPHPLLVLTWRFLPISLPPQTVALPAEEASVEIGSFGGRARAS